METNNIIIKQTLQKGFEDSYLIAEKYYKVIAVINDLNLTTREIQLIAFTAIRGNITYGNVRLDFCDKFNTTSATIGNMVCKLSKMRVFIKENGMVKVNPKIVLDFTQEIKLEINLVHE
jgi:hypothetical protein